MHFDEYVDLLRSHRDTSGAILRSVHAEIMLCMAKNAGALGVQKLGDDSPSLWQKTTVNNN